MELPSFAMPGSPTLRWTLAVLAAVALLPATIAAATPQDVITDWAFDGKVDGQTNAEPGIDVTHTAGDLQNAKTLIQAQDPGSAPVVIAAIQVAINRDVIGIDPPQGDPDALGAPDVSLPMWIAAAAVGAGLLLLAGIGSAIYRRSRRPPS